MTAKLLAIDPKGQGDVTDTHVKWSFGSAVPTTPSVVCFEDQVVMASEMALQRVSISILEKKYGASDLVATILLRRCWQGTGFTSKARPAKLRFLNLGQHQKKLAKNTLPGRIFASYSLIGNDLIIRTEKGVYRIGD